MPTNGSHAPSPSNDRRYDSKQDVVRDGAPVAPMPRRDRDAAPARSHATASAARAELKSTRRFDSKIEDLRTKRAGVVRDYASITQLKQHASVTRATKSDSLSSISPTSSPRELSVSSKALNNDSTVNTARSSSYYYSKANSSSSSSNQALHGTHDSPGVRRRTPKQEASSSSPAIATYGGDSQTELSEIKQSVQRLRAQRAHVEQLRHHNERLELLVAEQGKENEELRRELDSLRGVEQENVGLLQSFKLLEERLHGLEDICHEKRQQLHATHDKFLQAEAQRDSLEAAIRGLEHDHEQRVAAFRAKQTTLVDRIRQLERDQDAFIDKQQRLEEHWRDKVHHARQEVLTEQQSSNQELEASRKESKKLASEVAELETQVQKLLATTVRQTSMIEDCDRALSEAKAQQKTARTSYHDQLELNGRLNEQMQRLESQLRELQIGGESDRSAYEKRIFELESKLTKRKERIEIMQVALHEKDKQLQAVQREAASRDRNSEHFQELNADLRRREKTLLSEISELQIALGDVTDEKKILGEQILTLQEQLETERRDRSRWATARLKLLAEFCDEENKLSSALRFSSSSSAAVERHDAEVGDVQLGYEELDEHGDDDDDDDRRHGSIVFG